MINKLIKLQFKSNLDILNSYYYSINDNKELVNVINYSNDDLFNEEWIKLDTILQYQQYFNKKEQKLLNVNLSIYYISTLGRIVMYDKDTNKYYLQKVWNDGKIYGYKRIKINHLLFYVHRLVAFTFLSIKNYNDKKNVIDHIDGHKYNNRVSNLRCVTYSENSLNPNNISRKKGNSRRERLKLFKCLDILKQEIILYDSAYNIAKKLNCKELYIRRCAKYKIPFININNTLYIIIFDEELNLLSSLNLNQNDMNILNSFNLIEQNILNFINRIIQDQINLHLIKQNDIVDITKAIIKYKNNNTFNSYKMIFTDEELNNEEWRNISEYISLEYKKYLNINDKDLLLYENKNYYVSNLGRIGQYNKNTNILEIRPVNAYSDKNGYVNVNIYNQKYQIHRLVAYAFLENDNCQTKVLINHKDNIPYNNKVSNLEWCTPSYNINYKSETKRINKKKNNIKNNNKLKNEIIITNLDTNEIITLKSTKNTSLFLNCKYKEVVDTLSNRYGKSIIITSKGKFTCMYKNKNINTSRYKWEPIVQLSNKELKIIKIYNIKQELISASFDKINNITTQCRLTRQNLINNKRIFKSYHDFKWIYLSDYIKYIDNNITIPSILTIPIVELTENNNYIRIFDNIYTIINNSNYIVNIDKLLNMCQNINIININDLCLQCNLRYDDNQIYNTHRKYVFLQNYLNIENISSIDELSDNKKYKLNFANKIHNNNANKRKDR